MCYAVSVTRRGGLGCGGLGTPLLLPAALFLVYMIPCVAGAAWLVLFDREMLAVGFPVIAAMPLSLYVCIYLTCHWLAQNTATLVKSGLTADVWKIRLLVINGLGVYASWVSIATPLFLGICLAYSDLGPRLSVEDASTVTLAILSVELLVWFCLDMLKLDRYVRYLWVPYFVIIWALVGVKVKSGGRIPGERNSLLTTYLLAASLFAAVVKVIVMIWRHSNHPLYDSSAVKGRGKKLN